MPHNNHNAHSGHTGSSGDDLGSTDEVKIFKDEGDREDEKISSENLLEEKSSLIDLTESEEKSGKSASRQDHSPVFGKVEPHASSFNMGYLVSPYSYTNGAASGLPVSMANKMGLSPFFCHNGDPLTTPPPAHCGIPPYQLDPKAMGLTRPAIYPFPTSQYPYPMLSPDMSQVAASWHTPSVYSAASSFRSPYPSSLPINTTLSSDFSFRFSPSLLPSVHTPPHHVLNSHPAIVTPGPKQEIGQESNHRYSRSLDQKNSPSVQADCKDNSNEKKKPHIKKPLNAFMLYMKEMRAKVVAECTLKESAAINQILGRRWHELTREEQSKYYEKARQERQLHMELYPGWSARDNYGYVSKKKKRKKDRSPADSGGNNMKKCRARFGLDQQNQWCKPCRRKKKCIRYMEVEGEENNGDIDNHVSDDNLGSCGSVDDAKTPEDDTESLNQSLSSPGCLSGLSSLQSPSTSLASPLNLLTSPSTPNTMHNSHEQTYQQQQQQSQQITQHQSMFTDGAHQQQQQISNSSNSHLDKHKKCIGNNISNSNSITNSNDILNSTALNKHPLSLSLSLPSMISSTNTITSVPSSSISSSSTVSSSESGDIQIKPEKILLNTSISPLLGVHLAAMGIGPPNDRVSPQITVITSSSASVASSSSSSSLTSLPNHLFMDNMNKMSNILNAKSQSGSSSASIGEISNEIKQTQSFAVSLGMQTSIDDKSTVPLKPLSHRHQLLHHHHHHQQQQHPHQNSIINQINNSSNATNVQSTPPMTLPNSPFTADMFLEKAIRNPVGANPRDINNPLSINQLTKRDYTINTPNLSPTTPQQSLPTLQPPSSHHHIAQHHMHMLTTTSNAALTLSSPSISSSLSSSSLSNDNIQSLSISKSSPPPPPPTRLKTVDSNSSPFSVRTIGNDSSSNSSSIQQLSMQNLPSQHHSHHKQQQQQQQQQHHHQGVYQPSTSSSTSSSSTPTPTSSSSHHHHNLTLGQHLHHFSPHHHFPAVVGSSGSQNGNNLSGISTKSSPAVPTIGGQSNSTHHRNNDGDSGAISVT